MRKTLRHITWTCVLVAGAAAAHGSATTGICGKGQAKQVATFQFSEKQLHIYDECVKLQHEQCGIGESGEANLSRDPDCRPQYCSEVALDLPAHSLGGPVCTPMSCGVVDDAWGHAARLAGDYCAAQTPPGSAVAQVLSPPSFLDANNHHTLYAASQGLAGVCVQCVDVQP